MRELALIREIYRPSCLPTAVDEYRETLKISIIKDEERQIIVTIVDPAGGNQARELYVTFSTGCWISLYIQPFESHRNLSRRFQDAAAFGNEVLDYHLLPFRFIALDKERDILVNEAGEFLVVPNGTARKIVIRDIAPQSDLYLRLRFHQFVFDSQSAPLLDVLATKYRT